MRKLKTLCFFALLAAVVLRPESFLSILVKAPFGWLAKQATDAIQLGTKTKIYDELWEWGHNGPWQQLKAYFRKPEQLDLNELLQELEQANVLES